jgi:hypothetical protein
LFPNFPLSLSPEIQKVSRPGSGPTDGYMLYIVAFSIGVSFPVEPGDLFAVNLGGSAIRINYPIPAPE